MTGPSIRLRTGMLASVTSLEEARLVLEGGADIVDLKNPAAGALGALDTDRVREIVGTLGGRRPVSATVGDLPMEPATLLAAAAAMAATGVDYVKVGLFPGGDWPGCLAALAGLAQAGTRLVAVLFADTRPASHWLGSLADAGFAGAMLDTMDKGRGSLRSLLADAELAAFVRKAKAHGLLCGLAGSLRPADIPALLPLGADYLGFRGALCESAVRTASVNQDALSLVRKLLDAPAATAA